MNIVNKNLSGINLDSNESLKISSMKENEKLTKDLKNSLNLAINNTSDNLKDLQNAIDSEISDEVLRKDAKKIISHLQNEFNKSAEKAKYKFVNTDNEMSISKEEE